MTNDCQKLLDNKAYIVMFRNGLGSYTTACLRGELAAAVQEVIHRTPDVGPHITDDWTPEKSLYRLTEKQFGNIVGIDKEN